MMAVVAAEKTKLIFALLLFAGLISCGDSSSEPKRAANSPHFNNEWAMDKVWEDGKAEVAHYDAKMIIYGKPRQFDYVHITVKEEFNEEFNVKTDDYNRDDLFSVFKVNKFARFETENYPYHFLTSIFLPRDQIESMHKMTHTGQEWCGNTFKQFTRSEGGYRYDYNSYFDGSGHGTMEIEGNNLIWEDQLSTLLRSLKFEGGLVFNHRVVQSQVDTKARRPHIYDARFEVSEHPEYWEVNALLDNDKNNTYRFQKEYPNLLIYLDNWNGFKLKLSEVSRYQYWR